MTLVVFATNLDQAVMPEIDLKQLAIDRDETAPDAGSGRSRRRLLTRYILPGSMVAGFLLLAGWLGWAGAGLRNVLNPGLTPPNLAKQAGRQAANQHVIV